MGWPRALTRPSATKKLYLEDFDNLAEVEDGLADWVERIYNGLRLHSALGYQSPNEFEQNWILQSQVVGGLV